MASAGEIEYYQRWMVSTVLLVYFVPRYVPNHGCSTSMTELNSEYPINNELLLILQSLRGRAENIGWKGCTFHLVQKFVLSFMQNTAKIVVFSCGVFVVYLFVCSLVCLYVFVVLKAWYKPQ